MEILLLIWMIFGLIPAFIAQNKGRSFVKWYIYGVLLFWIALIHVLCVSNAGKKCPQCLSNIPLEAKACRYCGSKVK